MSANNVAAQQKEYFRLRVLLLYNVVFHELTYRGTYSGQRYRSTCPGAELFTVITWMFQREKFCSFVFTSLVFHWLMYFYMFYSVVFIKEDNKVYWPYPTLWTQSLMWHVAVTFLPYVHHRQRQRAVVKKCDFSWASVLWCAAVIIFRSILAAARIDVVMTHVPLHVVSMSAACISVLCV